MLSIRYYTVRDLIDYDLDNIMIQRFLLPFKVYKYKLSLQLRSIYNLYLIEKLKRIQFQNVWF